MRQMQSVLWTKGVLLSPQHLQTQDRFLEDLLRFRLNSLSFLPWGFSRLELDREALAEGTLAVTGAAGIFPDGLLFEMPEADPVPPPKPLGEHWEADQDSMVIHLAVPEHRPGGQNVSGGEDRRYTRYAAEVILRRDENTGKSEKPIQIARKNFLLLTDGETLEGHATLPVARVTRDETGGCALDPHFVPPLVDFTASEYLVSIARRLVETLTAKSSTLSGTRRQRGKGLADFGVSDIANFWLLYTVNTHLPQFRHFHEGQRGHPGELFGAMLELGGSLTTFSDRLHPRDLPTYAHGRLGECFAELDAMLRELLDTVVPVHHVSLPLKATEQAIYAAAIDEERFFSAPEWYIALTADMEAAELLRRAPQVMKVGAAGRMSHLIKQALPGIAFQHVPRPPSTLPVKLDHQYFRLDRTGAEWDQIRRSRNLAVYMPSDVPAPQLELLILLPGEQRG
jgi:type VI secretion system protein ImpJ